MNISDNIIKKQTALAVLVTAYALTTAVSVAVYFIAARNIPESATLQETKTASAQMESTAGDDPLTSDNTVTNDNPVTGDDTLADDNAVTGDDTLADDNAVTGDDALADDNAVMGDDALADDNAVMGDDTLADDNAVTGDDALASDSATVEEEIHSYTFRVLTLDTHLNVRAMPDVNSELIAKLAFNTTGEVLDYGELWSLIITDDGSVCGYVMNEYIEITDEAGNPLPSDRDFSSNHRKECPDMCALTLLSTDVSSCTLL